MESSHLKDPGYQKDLFSEIIHDTDKPGVSYPNDKKDKRERSLTLDKLLLFLLLFAIIFAVVFSYGIETGRRLSEEKSLDSNTSISIPSLQASSTPIERSSYKQTEQTVEVSQFDGNALADGQHTEDKLSLTPDQSSPIEKGSPGLEPMSLQMKAATPEAIEVKDPDEYWTVQVITYVNETYANQEILKFKQKGSNAFVIPSGKYLQVCVGKFVDRGEANKALEKLKKQRDYADAYLRRVTK